MAERQLDLKVRRAHDGSLSLEGSHTAIAGLALLLKVGAGALVSLTPLSRSPEPHQDRLKRISIEPELSTGLFIGCDGEALVLKGGRASLATLAENLLWFANQPAAPSGHMHIEYCPGHFYLREGSIPLVVALD